MTTPNSPTKYTGTNQYLAATVTRSRAPTGADLMQPETGKLYPLATTWQVGASPSTGVEGDIWMLSKIVANVSYWEQLSFGGSSSGGVQTISGIGPDVDGNIGLTGDGTTGGSFSANPSTNVITLTLSDIPNSALANSEITLIPGAGIAVSTSPVELGASTTISVGPTVPLNFSTQSHAAAAVANSINFLGANGISTSASGNTVTITGSGSGGALTFDASTGSAAPDAGVITFVGTNGITTSASGSTVTLSGSGSGGVSPTKVQTFASSGVYTPSAGMTSCIVEIVGGGGGGGSAYEGAAGGGGGSGGYARKLFTSSAIGSSQIITIGSLGAGASSSAANTGGNGGTTSLGSILLATGGQGGLGATAVGGTAYVAPGGLGGSGSLGDISTVGNSGYAGNQISGESGATNSYSLSGFGGSSFFGGGAPSAFIITTAAANGNAATSYGGGGSGGVGASGAGGDGFSGFVIITENIGGAAIGSGSGALVLLDTYTVTSPVLEIPFTTITSAYKTYKVIFSNVNPDGLSDALSINFSTDAGSTYLTSGYLSSVNNIQYNTGDISNGFSTVNIVLTGGETNTDFGCAGELTFFNLGTPVEPQMTGNVNWKDTVSNMSLCISFANNSTTDGVNAMKFNWQSGSNFTNGTFALYGLDETGGSGGVSVQSLSDDLAATVVPAGGNIQLVGHVVEQGATKFSTVTAGSNVLNINPMSPARWIVDPLGFNGTHTTIAAAVAAASTGDTILIFPGIYTENITIPETMLLYAYSASFRGGQSVTIVGKVTVSAPDISVGLNGIGFQTNGDNSILLSGTSSTITCQNCEFSADNATSIILSGSNETNIYMQNCYSFSESSQALFESTGGLVWIKNCTFIDTSAPLVASTSTVNAVFVLNSTIAFPINISGTSGIISRGTRYQTDGVLPCIAMSGSAVNRIGACAFVSGAASAITIGSGCSANVTNCSITSTNTNVFTGAGTINTGGNVCISSSGNDVATINHLVVI